jgi:hypothetical protein
LLLAAVAVADIMPTQIFALAVVVVRAVIVTLFREKQLVVEVVRNPHWC